MTRLSPAALRRLAHRRSPWRTTVPGRDPVPLAELVSPLRYDVVVRARFFEFYDARRDLYVNDFPAFLDAARAEPYFTWFSRIAMSRYKPRVAADPKLLAAAFEDRVRRAALLWEAFSARGFDSRFPVTLRVAGRRTRSPAGKDVRRPFYMGDGCHRLALLLASGQPMLPTELYRVDPTPLHLVIDNTGPLLRALDLSEADYVAFLAFGYITREVTPAISDLSDLTAVVRAERPELLDELEQVLAADGRAAPFQRSGEHR